MAADGTITIDTRLSTAGLQKGLKSVGNVVKKMINPFNKLAGLLTTIVGTTALIKFNKSAISMASDLQEVQNVVDTAFGDMSYKMEQFAETAIESFGISKLTAKQTGSTFMAMAGSLGLSAEKASDMAIALTGLSADMASFYNVEQSVASTALKSVFTGETETLKQYGIVMSEVNLNAFALSKGISKSLQKMTQAEKVQLRYAYVMEQTALAQGDFSKTSESWANQTRILSERWKEFMTLCGNGIVQVLTPAIKTLNNLLSTMINTVSAFNSVMGITKTTTEAGGAIKQTADSMQDLADSTEEAVDNTKKLLGTYDDLNVISTEDNSSSGGFDSLASIDYGTINNEIKDTTEAVDNLTTKWQKWIDLLKNGKYTALGANISRKIGDALKKIKWNEVYTKASNFGTDFAEYLNGLVGGGALASVGTTIAGALNTVIEGASAFFSTLNWTNYGLKLAESINNFFKTFDFAKLSTTISEFINGFTEYLVALVSNIDFEQVGKAIGEFFENLDWPRLIGTLWKLSQAIFDGLVAGIKGITQVAPLTTAFVALFALMNYTTIGTKIASCLSTYVLPVLAGAIAGWQLGTALYNNFVDPLLDAEWDKFMDSFKVSLTPAEQLLKQMSDHSKSIVDNLSSKASDRQGILAGIGSDADIIRDLATQYAELASNSNKTAEEWDKMNGLWSVIKEQYPELADMIDKCNGKYTEMVASIDSYIDSIKRQAETQVLSELMVETYRDLLDAKKELDSYTPEQLSKMQEEKDAWVNIRDQYLKARAELEKMNGTVMEGTREYKAQQEIVDKLAEAYIEQTDRVSATCSGYDALNDKIADLQTEYDGYAEQLGAIKTSEKEAKTSSDSLKNSTKNLGTTAKTSGEEIKNAFGVKAYTNVGTNIAPTIKNNVINGFNSIKANLTTSLNDAKSWITNPFEKKQFTNVGTGIGSQTYENIKSGFNNNTNQSTARGALQNAVNLVKNFFLPSKFNADGSFIVQGVNQGIKDETNKTGNNSLVTIVTNWANKIMNTFKTLFGIHSPSKVMAKDGKYIVEGLAQGIDKNGDIACDSMEDLANTMQDVTWGVDLEHFEATVNEAVAYANSSFLGVSPIYATGSMLPYNKSFSSAVNSTSTTDMLTEALKTATQTSSGDGNINLYIDGEKLFTWTQSKNNEYKKQYGSSAFA